MRRTGWGSRAGVVLATAGALLTSLAALQPAAALVPPGSGPTGAAAKADLDRHIATALAVRLRDSRLGSDVAIQVRDADGAAILFASRAKNPQMPASNMKLVTAFTTLTTLGPDAALSTRVATLDSGAGVVLVGRGDPLLSAGDLDRLARQTADALGASGSRLKVFVSDGYFRDTSLAPGWRRSYIPGEVTFVRSLGRHGVHVTDTAKEAGTYFVGRLRAHGIEAVYRGRNGGAGTVVAEVSHPVAQVLGVMLRDSDNQIAETLFRQVALARGRPATWAGGAAAARAILNEHGIPTDRVKVHDGSGLSRADRLTPAAVSRLLALVQSGQIPALDRLVSWLPVAGRTGTLGSYSGRYTTAPSKCAAGKVHAKTGTLTGALALSGTAVGYDGRSRIFSILVNHPPTSRYSVLTVRRAMDGLAATVTGCW